ncbi:MAG: hypothetical protein IPK63_10840 [Candidatus Competibacteraceae bacterium]|nr:hypothetical protein [Candidatus Competibacteraceae bacterium]
MARDSPRASPNFSIWPINCNKRSPTGRVSLAFWNWSNPACRMPWKSCASKVSATSRLCPPLLMAAGHVKNDLPVLLKIFQDAHPETQVNFGADLGIHPNLLQVARERIETAEAELGVDY